MQRVTEVNSTAEGALPEGLLPLCDDPARDQILAGLSLMNECGLVPLPNASPLFAAPSSGTTAVLPPSGPANGDLAIVVGGVASASGGSSAPAASTPPPEDVGDKGECPRQSSPDWEDLGSSLSFGLSSPESPREGDAGLGSSRSRISGSTPAHTPSKRPRLHPWPWRRVDFEYDSWVP